MNKLRLAVWLMALWNHTVSAQSATSANAAGFIKLDLEDANFYQITVPFVAMSSPLYPSDAFDNLPNGSTIIFWDKDTQSYHTDAANETKLLGSWTPNTNNLYQRSFWLYVGETASPTSFSSIIYGRVPDRSTLPTQNVSIVTSGNTNVVNLTSYAYPVDISWTNSALAKAATSGSYLLLPNEAGNGFIKMTKSGTTWPTNATISAGQSFWFHAATGSSNVWQEAKPYDWP